MFVLLKMDEVDVLCDIFLLNVSIVNIEEIYYFVCMIMLCWYLVF